MKPKSTLERCTGAMISRTAARHACRARASRAGTTAVRIPRRRTPEHPVRTGCGAGGP